jgi:cobalt transporter subunit CbtB
MTRKPGDLPCVMKPALGDEGQGVSNMTTKTAAIARTNTDILAIALAALMGAALIFVAGFANSATIHDAAHDQRHAIGFPCH